MVSRRSAKSKPQMEPGVDDIRGMEPGAELMPKLISKNTAIKVLADFMGKKITPELNKLMKIPKEIYLLRRGQNFVLSDQKDFRSLNMIKALFGGPGRRLVSLTAGYGIEVRQSTSHTYILFIDTSRRLAVKTTLSSMYEGEAGWTEFKNALKAAIKESAKIPKTDKTSFIVFEDDMLKKTDLSVYS